MPDKNHILTASIKDLEQIADKKFRVSQILNWIYKNYIIDFDNMKNLSKDLRAKLSNKFDNKLPKILKKETSIDGTQKFLLELSDKNEIEMVLIPYKNKNTLCVSSQVGCKRNCQFCATAKMGLIRNLETYEILSQIYIANRILHNDEKKLTNIVFMGMGEPLDNFDNVIKAVELLQNNDTFSFSPRRITISTSGVVPGIYKLSEINLKIKLAVSLNAAINEKRRILMPITIAYPLAELKKALKNFRKHSPYRITFEYVMIKNFNMFDEDIKAISSFLGDISCKLNLIPWNKVSFLDYESPSEEEVLEFEKKLQNNSFAVTRRKSRGSDISAACGQLAIKSKLKKYAVNLQ